MCNTMYWNGEIEINPPRFNPWDYTYIWYVGDTVGTRADQEIPTAQGTETNYLHNIPGGTYTVKISSKSNMCDTLITFKISDEKTPHFNVKVYETSPMTNTSSPDGSLKVFAYTDTITGGIPADTLWEGYHFTWYRSAGGVNAVGVGKTINNLMNVSYLVEVEYKYTGCVKYGFQTVSSSATKYPPPDTIQLILSNESNTNCINPNGRANARLINVPELKNPFKYDVFWFRGQVQVDFDTLKVDFKGATWENLTSGFYTALAIDRETDEFVASGIIEIKEEITYPEFDIDIRTEGEYQVPSIHISDFWKYRYDWYSGKIDQPDTSFLFSGSIPMYMEAGVYTLFVTELNSGCHSLQSFNLEEIIIEDTTVIVDTTKIVEDSILLDAQKAVLSIYPNPTSGKLYVDGSVPIRDVELYALDGKRHSVNTIKSDTGLTINMQDNEPGIYLLKFNSGSQIQCYRVLKL